MHSLFLRGDVCVCVCVCVGGGGGGWSISDIVSNIEKDNLTIFCLLEVTFKIHLA